MIQAFRGSIPYIQKRVGSQQYFLAFCSVKQLREAKPVLAKEFIRDLLQDWTEESITLLITHRGGFLIGKEPSPHTATTFTFLPDQRVDCVKMVITVQFARQHRLVIDMPFMPMTITTEDFLVFLRRLLSASPEEDHMSCYTMVRFDRRYPDTSHGTYVLGEYMQETRPLLGQMNYGVDKAEDYAHYIFYWPAPITIPTTLEEKFKFASRCEHDVANRIRPYYVKYPLHIKGNLEAGIILSQATLFIEGDIGPKTFIENEIPFGISHDKQQSIVVTGKVSAGVVFQACRLFTLIVFGGVEQGFQVSFQVRVIDASSVGNTLTTWQERLAWIDTNVIY